MVEELSHQGLAILAVAGVLATVVNVMAGGGGMIVLPALMALGIPADVANGTYRLSVVTQSLAGTSALARNAGQKAAIKVGEKFAEKSVIKANDNVPVYVKDVARVTLGPALRRGVLDKGGAEMKRKPLIGKRDRSGFRPSRFP